MTTFFYEFQILNFIIICNISKLNNNKPFKGYIYILNILKGFFLYLSN